MHLAASVLQPNDCFWARAGASGQAAAFVACITPKAGAWVDIGPKARFNMKGYFRVTARLDDKTTRSTHLQICSDARTHVRHSAYKLPRLNLEARVWR